MTLYPAILTASDRELQAYLDVCQPLLPIDTVQIDIIDGSFADNLTISPLDLVLAEWGRLQTDVHLMVEEPMDFVYELVSVKEQLPVRAVLAQIEKMSSQAEYLAEVRKHGWKAGLSLDIFTPIEEIDEASWRYLDVVQLMGVEAGFQGQTLKPLVFEKLSELKAALPGDHPVEIIVDGGVTQENYAQLLEAGATGIAVGSKIWTASSIPDAVLAFTR